MRWRQRGGDDVEVSALPLHTVEELGGLLVARLVRRIRTVRWRVPARDDDVVRRVITDVHHERGIVDTESASLRSDDDGRRSVTVPPAHF